MKDIIGYEGLYAITSCGKVWSYRSNKFLKPYIDIHGYHRVDLSKDGIVKHYKIHRLVAETYIQNPENLETIDHIDGIKSHNHINNLQWMTSRDNTVKSVGKKVLCVETGIIYNCTTDAAAAHNGQAQSIRRVCRGERKTAYGYHWEYI